MNRKLALAASVSASTALVAGAVMVGALLSQGPEAVPSPDVAAPLAETDSSVTSVDPIVVYQDEYEFVATGEPPAAVAAPQAADDEGGFVASAPAGVTSPVVASVPSPVTTAAPTTTAPRAATTTTTRPPGVPRDWPADKPIPPMPANCREPQLEDNGVWNCQH